MRMKDSLLCVHVVVETLKFEISRCHLEDTSRNCTEERAARAARLFYFIQPIKSLICGVFVDVAVVKC